MDAMGLGTGQSRDGRRRRVLLDETLAGERPVAKSTKSMKRRRNYTDAALNDLQPRVTDLMPTKWSTMTILFGAALTAIAAVVALHVHRDQLGSGALARFYSPLWSEARGSLADWLSSVFFLLSAAVAAQIFAIRRHRLDDYRGSYRVWLWVTPLLLWLSIDSVTHLRAPLAEAISKLPWFPQAHATWWWAGAYVTIFGMMAVRLIIETRRCRAAWPILLVAAGLYGFSFAAYRDLFEMENVDVMIVVRRLAAMLGHWSVLLSLVLYARYVHLDAEGKLRAKKPAKPKKAEASETSGDSVAEGADAKAGSQTSPSDAKDSRMLRTDGAHSTPPKPNSLGAFIAGAKGGSNANASSSDDDDEDDDRGLSRAERRRLKKANR